MKTLAGLPALVFVLASCATLTPATSPTHAPMTVSYVRAHLKDLHGKTIRMQGEMNNCTSLTCEICEDINDDDTCLGMDFYGDSYRAVDVIEELYRFATITIDAEIDASCGLGYDPDEPVSRDPDRDVVIICTDRASVIEEARVVSVQSRKPASLGRFDMYKGELLEEADVDSLQQVQAFLRGLPWADSTDDQETKLFIDPDPWKDEKGFYYCECTEETCAGRWPTWSGHTYTRSPGNPYYCSYVAKIGDNWVLTD